MYCSAIRISSFGPAINTNAPNTLRKMRPKPLAVLVWIIVVAILLAGEAVGATDASIHRPVVQGSVFISVIFPAVEVNYDQLEMIESIPDAYTFWGRIIMSATTDKGYFPAPLSYPYRYTKRGLDALQTELKKFPQVDSVSIRVRTFPNIPSEQRQYEPSELKRILLNETYVSFRLKKWKHIEFMAFPTFLVLAFDYVTTKINSAQDYEQVKQTFRSVIDEFQSMENIKSAFRKRKGDANLF